MTMVLNLETGEELWFSCSPEEAVVCAYNQSRHLTWSYDYRMAKKSKRVRVNYRLRPDVKERAKKSKTGKTVSCGNFAAVV